LFLYFLLFFVVFTANILAWISNAVPTEPGQVRSPTWNLRKHGTESFPRFSSFIFVWLINRCACGRPCVFRFCSVGERLSFRVTLNRLYG